MAEKILIVDDDLDTVRFIGTFLKSQGYEPLGASDGMTALKVAHERHPDLIVLDVMMPGLDGFEVARSLRRHPETALIPILMFTAKTQMEDKLSGYEAGVDIYLAKPAHPVELQANIKALLAQSKARSETLSEKGYMVGVMSAKGGLGVSTVALNLAIACAQKNTKVIAVETRPGQGSWRDELGFTGSPGLDDLLMMSPVEIIPAAIEKQLLPNTFGVPLLLASNDVPNATSIMAVAQYEAILENISTLADVVVLDIGTNYHPAYEVFTRLCDEMILVTEPQPLSVKVTRHLVVDLKTRNYGSAKPLTLVTVNRIRAEMSIPMSKMEEGLGHSISLGFTPVPEQAYLAAERATPMYLIQPQGVIARQFDNLADQVIQHRKG